MDTPRWINIAPLLPGREEEVARDLHRLARETCIDSVAFSCSLHPEGDPPIDKAAAYAERVVRTKAALGDIGLRVGVLVQSTMGHGYRPDSPSPFQRLQLRDGREPWVCCPLDAAFRAHIRAQVAELVERADPEFLLVDDDTRLGSGYGGCVCPLHRAELARRAGRAEMTAADIAAALPGDAALQRAYDDLQADSMELLFRDIRAGIDSVRPGLPVILCSCGYEMPLSPRFAGLLAAPGQRRSVRLNNGRYIREGLRDVPFWLHGTSWQIAQAAPDMDVLCEPDTCPHNRYATAATILHYHVALSVLEGCRGAKFWITRLAEWEPASGEAYRRLLARNKAYYPALAALRPSWDGLRVPLAATATWGIDWGSSLFGAFGFPYANVRAAGDTPPDTSPAAPWALSGYDVLVLSDAELRGILRGRVLLDGGAAVELARRGFAPLTGVEARDWGDLPVASYETWEGGCVNHAVPAVDLRSHDAAATELSTLFHRPWELAPDGKPVAPGTLLFDNAVGGRVLTVSFRLPTLDRELGHWHAYNETRKRRLAELLTRLCDGDGAAWTGGARFAGDEPLFFRTGTAADGTRLWLAMPLCLDPVEEIPLVVDGKAPQRIERLSPNATWEPVDFATTPFGIVLRLPLRPLEPAVLRLD